MQGLAVFGYNFAISSYHDVHESLCDFVCILTSYVFI